MGTIDLAHRLRKGVRDGLRGRKPPLSRLSPGETNYVLIAAYVRNHDTPADETASTRTRRFG
jgi:hypothetical protein